MTARPPEPLHDDALSAEERELAMRLARLDGAAGPSAALDARILAAAHAAVAPRRAPRWPRAVGAAAVLVAAVGLAWQLKPMFALPPPLPAEHAGRGAGAEADVVVQVESVPRAPQASAAAAAPVADVAATAAAPAAARTASPVAGGGVPVVAQRRVVTAPVHASRPHEFVDEAVPPADAVAAPAAAPVPSAESAAMLDRVESRDAHGATANTAARAAAKAAPPPDDDIGVDARLPIAGWLARIRARRDAGDLDGARASLARFVATHPRARVPNDLQPLLHEGDPWGQ